MRDLSTEQLCSAAGIADRTYRRAPNALLTSRQLELVSGAGGRDPDRYPARDEVADYLERYAETIPVELQTNTRVSGVHQEGHEFVVITADGRHLRAAGIVAASGSLSNPHRPIFPGQRSFTGQLLHVAEYRNPTPYAGLRVVVVGAGDSAAQVANELALVADVTVAARHPLRFIPQRLRGHDVHYWLRETGFDSLPAAWLSKIGEGRLITDSVGFRQTLADGLVDVRPMFIALDGDEVVWASGKRERVARSSSPPATGPVSATWASSAHLIHPARGYTSAGSPPSTSGWSTWAWSTSGPLPLTRCAG